MALTELGPTFIKLGQLLSTRSDLVGVELANELRRLQADAPADPPEAVLSLIAQELGHPTEVLFAEFDPRSMASASIGQVHRARLKTGELVVVKVQHPGIEAKLQVDLDILVGLAQWAERIPEFAPYHLRAIATEFQRTIRRELDFRREMRNAQEFGREFARDSRIRIPRVYPSLSTCRVLTMELLDGIKLVETDRLQAAGLDLNEVARRGAQLYLEMIFSHGRYHADPHPGNLVLMDGNVIGLLDFGMIGQIDEQLQEDIEELVLAASRQDAEHVTAVITRLGAIPPELDRAALGLDVADFITHFGSQTLEQLDLSGVLNDLTEIIRRYQISLPSRIALLIKVLVTLEGTAHVLSPRFSLLELMQPYRRRLLAERFSPARQYRRMRRIYWQTKYLMQVLPRGIIDIVEQIQSGKFDVHLDHRGLEPSVNRLVLGMLASALFLGSSLLLSRGLPPTFHEISVPGMAGCLLGLALGWRLWRAINRSLERRR